MAFWHASAPYVAVFSPQHGRRTHRRTSSYHWKNLQEQVRMIEQM